VPAPDRYLIARCGGLVVAGLGRSADEDPDVARWRTYVSVTSADDAAALVRDNGGTVRTGPVDAGPAGRSALCFDPSGAEIGLWQPGARIGVELVNAPGSWNWSDLHTPDPDAARRFYERVFGWEARPVDMGGFAATMWAVPGYGDALAELDPGLRERHAADHVPAGFSDAIGWLLPADDRTSSWQVTFAVDDPDAVAERAAANGGRVLSEPTDQGPVRITTLADAAGATFTASRYQP
jgi:predicted enzyme related to lactoylglutathione lyase